MKIKKNITILFYFLLFIIINSLVYSQPTGGIKVLVRDSVTRESIPFAIVQIMNTKLGVSADVNGMCLLKNIPTGRQSIQTTAVGYKQSIKTAIIEEGKLASVNVYLSPEPVIMQPVTKIVERSKDAYGTNISVQTITQDDIKIVPMALEKDIMRMLKVMPGISSTGDVTNQFFVRGGSGDQNLILYDNMLIYNPFHALGLFSIFNGESIKASDVITGGFSPEYGGKLSSVINITSKEGSRTYYGGKVILGMLSGQLYAEGPIAREKSAFSISFRKSYFDKVLKKVLSKEVPLSFYDLAAKTTFDFFDQGKVFVNFLISGDDISDSRPIQPDYQWKSYSFGSTIQSFIGQFLLNTSASYSSFKNTMDPKSTKENVKLNSEINDFLLSIKADYLLGNNDLLSVGSSLIDQRMNFSYINGAGYYIDFRRYLTEMNVWAKYRINWIRDCSIELGIRENMNNTTYRSYNNLEPRVNIKYQINTDFALKGSFTRMHQLIMAVSNEDDIVSLFEAWIPIEGKFFPERADQYVFGLEGRFYEYFNLTLQSYYKRITNYLGYNLQRESNDDPDFSSGEGKSYGLEMFLKYNFKNYFGWITYNLNWATKTLDGFTFSPRYDKRHSINICFGTKLPYDIDFSLNWEGSSGMPFTPKLGYYYLSSLDGSPSLIDYMNMLNRRTVFGEKNSRRLPFYHKLDLSFSKSFIISGWPKINVMLDIINVYDQKNIFYFDMKTGERINMLPFLPTISVGAEL